MAVEKEKENMVKAPSMQELLEAGVHFGHQVRRGHPRMNEYIYGVRDGVHIINLELSEKKLQEALKFAYELGEEGKILVFVGTKKQAQPIVKEAAEKTHSPYVDFRWLGGTLTNFDEIRRNIKKLKDLQAKKAKGELGHYTKKEQLLISRKLDKFEKEWGGLADLDHLPDALFVVDAVTDKTAITEANRMGIKVLGIADTNSNPALMDYPIPGNDDATKSIKIITEAVAEAYGEGMKQAGKPKEEPKVVKKKEKPEKESKETEETIEADVAAAEEALEKEELEKAERVVE